MSGAAGGLAVVLVSYLLGSVPWGVVLGRAFAGTDIRAYGSGGTGATNAQRVLGWRISVPVLILDFLKGWLPIFVGGRLGVDGWWLALAGVAAVVGHCWSPFIGFTGGKGVATAGGAATALYPPVLLALPVAILIVAVTRYVSLASITVSLLASAATVVLAATGRIPWSVPAGIVLMTLVIVYKHESNIRRLLSGTERRFGDRVEAGKPAS